MNFIQKTEQEKMLFKKQEKNILLTFLYS